MAKKGGAKGGKGKKKKKVVVASTFVYHPPNVHDLGIKPIEYVSLSVKMAELVHLGFEWPMVPTIVTIASLKDAIRKRHGGTIMEVLLYKDSVLPTNKVVGEPETLADIGITGVADGTNVPQVNIFYDFPLVDMDCPLLLAPPHEEMRRFPSPQKREKSPRGRRRPGSGYGRRPESPRSRRGLSGETGAGGPSRLGTPARATTPSRRG